jgi:hypothetical protein
MVDSEIDKGTTFTVSLPARPELVERQDSGKLDTAGDNTIEKTVTL